MKTIERLILIVFYILFYIFIANRMLSTPSDDKDIIVYVFLFTILIPFIFICFSLFTKKQKSTKTISLVVSVCLILLFFNYSWFILFKESALEVGYNIMMSSLNIISIYTIYRTVFIGNTR